jgi:hypothetical protein
VALKYLVELSEPKDSFTCTIEKSSLSNSDPVRDLASVQLAALRFLEEVEQVSTVLPVVTKFPETNPSNAGDMRLKTVDWAVFELETSKPAKRATVNVNRNEFLANLIKTPKPWPHPL